MIDITQYSEDELSLNVFNDEELYKLRHTGGLKYILDDIFIYTDEQMEILENDLADDLIEEEE